jgi:hypothetical protein
MTLRKAIATAVLAILVVLVVVQFPKVERTNPRTTGEASAPPAIAATLRRACYDCHSNETRWPWYSQLAPVSWLIVRDVTLARKEINFSEWNSYYPLTRQRKLAWMERTLREEKMPPWAYRLMQPESRLTDADRAALERWIQSALAALPADQSSK